MGLTRLAGAATRRPRTTIALWLGLVIACSAAGAITGTKTIGFSEGGTGESARADELVKAAGLQDPAAERVLPAIVSLLGDRGWRVRARSAAWDHRPVMSDVR